ncbi:MAG: ATP-binding cassette domain-containing protein, partial [Crocinitomicaceae bacterium]
MIKVSELVKDFRLTKQQIKESTSNERIQRAVDHVSFTCEPGKVFSLLGPNGAGKTTTLRMLSTIFTPTAGSIEICGIDALKEPEKARSKIGFLT